MDAQYLKRVDLTGVLLDEVRHPLGRLGALR